MRDFSGELACVEYSGVECAYVNKQGKELFKGAFYHLDYGNRFREGIEIVGSKGTMGGINSPGRMGDSGKI